MSETSGGEPAPAGAAALDEADRVGTPVELVELSKLVAAEVPPQPSEKISFQSMADRLTLGLLAAIIGAVLVFVSSFLTWASVNAKSSVAGKVSGATVDYLGISSHRLGLATLVLSIAAIALCGVMLLPATKEWAWKLLVASGVLVAVLAIVELIQIPRKLHSYILDCNVQGVTCTLHRSIGPGVWFTLIAGILLAVGAYVHHIRPVPFRAQPAGRPAPAAAAHETVE